MFDGNLVDADASGASQHKTPWITFTGHSRSRILGSLKSRRGTAYYLHNNVSFRIGNFEGKVWASLFSRTSLSFGAPYLGNPCNIRTYLTFLETRIIDLHFALLLWFYLRSKFSGGLRKMIFPQTIFGPFKVIQGHWYWYQYQSKARMRLRISPSE